MAYRAKFENGELTITFPVKDTTLPQRKCARCGSQEIREIDNQYTKRMLSCSLDCTNKGCGHLLRIGFNNEETRCGDIVQAEYFVFESTSSMPLSVCINCGRICSLQ